MTSPSSSLEALGLSESESKVYLCLLGHSWLGAPAVAEVTQIPRSSVYLVLRSLIDMGLVEGGAGYGSRFRALPPRQGVTTLLERDREELQAREEVAEGLLPRLEALSKSAHDVEEQVIEVLHSPKAVAERFERLQLEATTEVDVVVKNPIVLTNRGNPAELAALKRGVRYRGLYERAILEHSEVHPHLAQWYEAGEDLRVYPGELPLKLALFDSRSAFLPLPTPGSPNGITSLLIRHDALGAGLQTLFDHLWARAEPFQPATGKKRARRPTS